MKKAKAINRIAGGLTLLSFATALAYLDKPTKNLGVLTLIIALIAITFNAWAFYKRLKRNRKRGLLYYLQPEWQNRLASGWEGSFNPVSNIVTLAGGFWLSLGAGLLVYPDNIGFRVLFTVLGLCEVAGWAYSTYTFETSNKIYQDNSGFYSGMLSQIGITIAIGIVTIMFSLRPTFDPINIIPPTVALYTGLIRWFLPQRYFGPKAIRLVYRQLNNPGWLWSKKSRSLVYRTRARD